MSTESVMPSNHLTLCLALLLPSIFPSIRGFFNELAFALSGQRIRALAPASVLPVVIQAYFPLGLTGLISLPSKGLSSVFSSPTIWEHYCWIGFKDKLVGPCRILHLLFLFFLSKPTLPPRITAEPPVPWSFPLPYEWVVVWSCQAQGADGSH